MLYQCSLFLYHTSDLSDHLCCNSRLEGSKTAKFGFNFDPILSQSCFETEQDN